MLVNANFLRADDVTRTMSRTMSKGGVLVKNPVSVPGPPPPFKNPGSAPACAHGPRSIHSGGSRMWGTGGGGRPSIQVKHVAGG